MSAAYHPARMSEPAYSRLPVDERRTQLLDLGVTLFATHSYDELSMARIAREAGISKALLYHYFPGKQEFFAATLAQSAAELRAATEPDPELSPRRGAHAASTPSSPGCRRTRSPTRS